MQKIIIAAMAKNRTIGKNNTLPWHIPEELQLFKKTTMGYPLIMGRTTFESLPGILPGRQHIVLTRNPAYKAKGVEVAHSWEEAFSLCAEAEKGFIIGGEKVFIQALQCADYLQLTTLEREVEGDRFFPPFEHNFRKISCKQREASENFSVGWYQRKTDRPVEGN